MTMTVKFSTTAIIVVFFVKVSSAQYVNRVPELHAAARASNIDKIRSLLAMGANPNKRNNVEQTALHIAAMYGQTHVISELIAAHADIEAQDMRKATPLHSAAIKGNWPAVRALIQAGAHIQAQAYLAATPLHVAVFNGCTKAVKILLDAGADINAQLINLATPLHMAAYGGHLKALQLLVQYGACLDQVDTLRRAAANVATNQSIKDYLHSIPQLSSDLQEAATKFDADIIKRLVAQGAPILTAGLHGDTLISQVIRSSNPQNRDSVNMVACMLIQPVRPRAIGMRNHEGQTLLHLAIGSDNFGIALSLLHHGASVNAQDRYGNTPLHYALNKNMRDLLIVKGGDFSLVNQDGQTPISANIQLWLHDLERFAEVH